MTDKDENRELLKIAMDSPVTDDMAWIGEILNIKIEESGGETPGPEEIIMFGVECFRVGYMCGLGEQEEPDARKTN